MFILCVSTFLRLCYATIAIRFLFEENIFLFQTICFRSFHLRKINLKLKSCEIVENHTNFSTLHHHNMEVVFTLLYIKFISRYFIFISVMSSCHIMYLKIAWVFNCHIVYYHNIYICPVFIPSKFFIFSEYCKLGININSEI